MLIYVQIDESINDIYKGIRTRGLGSIPGDKRKEPTSIPGLGYPEGTIRSWQDGDVIKRGKDWVPIEIPNNYYHKTIEISHLVNEINNSKILPINNERLVDKILLHHLSKDELERGEFKKYSGGIFPVFLGYQASIGFHQMYVGNWLYGREDEQIKMDRLNIMEQELQSYINLFDIWRNKSTLPKEEQENFKKLFDELDSFHKEYIYPLSTKRKRLDEIKEEVKNKFEKNRPVETLLELIADDRWAKYKKDYREKILTDESNRVLDEAGLTLDSPSNIFYKKMLDKATEEDFEYVEPSLIKRIKHKTNINITGNWNKGIIPVLKHFEDLAYDLPKGHIINNELLKELENHSYTGVRGNAEGYAFYDGDKRKISLSDMASSFAGLHGNLKDYTEFSAVLTHEVGHSVSAKFGRSNNIIYKEFVMLCGWDNRQRKELIRTAGQPDSPRKGRNNERPLLTNYSYKSPEESFAEYYSIYYLNKDSMDKWLNTGDADYITNVEGSYNKPVWNVKEKKFDQIKTKSEGIEYRGDFIPLYLLEKNKKPLEQIRKIFHNPKLMKALRYILEERNIFYGNTI